MAELISSRMSSSFSFSRDFTKAPRTVSNRLLRAPPATRTRAPRARALKAVMGWWIRVGMRTGKTLFARTWTISITRKLSRSTHAHDLLQGLECGLRSLSRISHSLQQCRDSLVDSLGSHVVLHGIERLGRRSPDDRRRIDQCGSDSGNDGFFVICNNILV